MTFLLELVVSIVELIARRSCLSLSPKLNAVTCQGTKSRILLLFVQRGEFVERENRLFDEALKLRADQTERRLRATSPFRCHPVIVHLKLLLLVEQRHAARVARGPTLVLFIFLLQANVVWLLHRRIWLMQTLALFHRRILVA